MRHKYVTEAFVLGRTPLAESASLVVLLTSEFGIVRARAEGLRKSGAKLAHALQTFDACEVTLVRGKEGWRLSGALLTKSWFRTLSASARTRAGRVAGLFLRLVHGEANDPSLFTQFTDFLAMLEEGTQDMQDTAECIAALKLLSSLGLDAGPVPEYPATESFSPETRRDVVTRINRGITASGL